MNYINLLHDFMVAVPNFFDTKATFMFSISVPPPHPPYVQVFQDSGNHNSKISDRGNNKSKKYNVSFYLFIIFFYLFYLIETHFYLIWKT